MIVFLVGMMGSGKTTIGKALAERMHFPFFDTDSMIEISEKMSVKEIFESKGEDYFRILEKKLILDLNICDAIIATGGGLPCFNNLMETLNEQGLTIYLKCDTAELVKRIQNSNTRPILKGLNGGDLTDLLNTLKTNRSKYYSKSKYVILSNPKIVDVVDKVVEKLKHDKP